MAYLLSLLLVSFAFAVALFLDNPSSSFLLATMAVTLYGGRGPAWLSVLLSSCLFEFFFLLPPGHFVHPKPEWLRFLLFAGAMTLTVELIEARRRSESRRLRTEEDLRKTEALLARASQIATASELAAAITHEISQPLSAMVANGQAGLHWLNAEPPNYSDGRAAIERIVRDGKDAANVIKGLRSLFERTPLEKTAVDLRELAREVVALLRSKAAEQSVTMELAIPSGLPPVLGEKIQLQQVLVNLVSNAIESMQGMQGRARHVIIGAHRHEGSLLLSVEDHGPGVEHLQTVFDPFATTKATGMGMGLAICRTIIEDHQGRLWVERAASGGSIFFFTVPVSQVMFT